jgi:hypothetical protein
MSDNPQSEQAQRAQADSKRSRESALVRQSTGLAPYGTAEELAVLVGRFKTMVPGADKLEQKEVWALAQASFMHGLNPIIGECYWINGFSPGIKGIRRKSHEQVRERYGEGEDWRIESYRRIDKAVDLEARKIPAGALTFEADLVISAELRDHADTMKKVREALGSDAPYDVILANAGPRPVTIGIGYVTKEQMYDLDHPRWYHKCPGDKPKDAELQFSKSGSLILRGQEPCPYCGKESYAKPSAMPHEQRAKKRAEAHAIKQRFDLPFDFNPNSGEMIEEEWDYGDVIEGSAEDVTTEFDALAQVAADAGMEPEEAMRYLKLAAEQKARDEEDAALSPEEIKDRGKKAAETMFGAGEAGPVEPDDEPHPIGREVGDWSLEHIRALKKGKFVPETGVNDFNIKGRLAKSPFAIDDPIPWIGEWMLLYAKHRSNTDSDGAAAKATDAFKEAHREDEKAIGRFGADWLKG